MALTLEQLYQNVLRRPSDPGGYSWWQTYMGPTIDQDEINAFVAQALKERPNAFFDPNFIYAPPAPTVGPIAPAPTPAPAQTPAPVPVPAPAPVPTPTLVAPPNYPVFGPTLPQPPVNPTPVTPPIQVPITVTPVTSSGQNLAPQTPTNVSTNLPPALTPGTNTQSRIDPTLQPYLELGLRRAQQLFLSGTGPQLYPEQMFVSPSAQTTAALARQEQIATGMQPTLDLAQGAYRQSLMGLGTTAGGGFLEGSPYREAMMTAATRPLIQQYTESVVPGIASGFSRAGRYGSGAMERAQSQAAEAFGRSLGDVTANIAAQDYARERGLQQQAQIAQSALAQAAPSFFQASLLPSQTLAQVGAAREAIAAQPLEERIQRFQYQQQLPYQQLQGYLSSVYGTPMGSSQAVFPQSQTNRLGQAIGLGTLGFLGGQALGGTTFGLPNSVVGALGGGLLGGLF